MVPSGGKARFQANTTAIRIARQLAVEKRPATPAEQEWLSGWSSWGAIPDLFDDSKTSWEAERAELRALLSEDEWRAASRTTLNAHYTDPMLVKQVWTALSALGFDGGQVLEPGSGSGTFIGLSPEGTQVTGVELDPVTAAISQTLYPHATIRAESFADTRIAEGYFDAAVGNVPFGDVALHDPVHNATKQSLHNHFIIKALRLTRPGGIVAVLTSRYTMDAQNPGARREMNALADLVGAIRLPSRAHQRTAGTDVITDLLILRRRMPDESVRDFSWETVTRVQLDGQELQVNRYFDVHPEHVLGRMEVTSGQFGPTLAVSGDLDRLEADFTDVLEQVTFSARREGLTQAPRSSEHVARQAAAVPSEPGRWDGTIVAREDGSFGVVVGDLIEPFKVPRNAAVEMRALLRLRDGATRLLTMESASVDDSPELEQARTELRREYQKYVGKYRALNRYSLRRTGRENEQGEETFARIVPTPIRLLRSDPFGALVLALEVFDDEAQTAVPAALLTRRVVTPRPEIQGVETAADAIAVSLDRTGGIDLAMIADLLGVSEAEAQTALGDLVFTDPETNELIHAPAYLSGNIYEKLEAAEARTETDPAFQVNVDELRKVLPEPLDAADVTAKIGAVWIGAEIHQQFLRELLGTNDVRVSSPMPGMWEVKGGRQGLRATSEWGTKRRSAPELLKAIAEQRPIIVHDEIEEPDGTKHREVNTVQTAFAQEKADALAERFSTWVWEDPERARNLLDKYNRTFNGIVLRNYEGAGDYLTFPGMASGFVMRPHQRAAVARMIAEPAAGLFHEVGAGKTAEMIAGVMEMRRMGLISKPILTIPNHMLEQFTREWLQLYPQAKILAASSKDLTADKRRQFIARAAANEWDGILITHSAFGRIPMRPENEHAYRSTQIEELRTALSNVDPEERLTVKKLEKKLLSAEEKLKKLVDKPRDPGVSFEDTGVDYVVVDELHLFKNLRTESNIPDANVQGSERASDLHMKVEYLRSQGKKRVMTGATATPISNSITEAYTMQRYLRPDLLEAAGLGGSFDAWAATFGETLTQMEMSPTGASFRLKTRFAKFKNVPEMLRMWSTFADVKTADDLQLPIPLLHEREDGQRAPEARIIQPTAELQDFVKQLGERAEAIMKGVVDPREDNMLSVTSDGRKAALDMRLIIPGDPSGPSKTDVAAGMIYRVWQETRDHEYLDVVTGELSDVKGALQLVFADLSTPNPDKWNVYEELKLQLIVHGMPAESIRFIHEAKNDVEKARLFAAARAGHISVLIGSTERMGVGTNVQARAVALYHLDCPWRPSDIAQREGRILRQGNQNETIGIVRLITERSFDSYMWQGVERKARFIAQVMRGNLNVREIEEIDSASLSAAEAKALATGNPLMLEHATLQSELHRLKKLEQAHHSNERMLEFTRDTAKGNTNRLERELTGLESALPRVTDTSGDSFRIVLNDRLYTSRADAAQALARWTAESGIRYLPNYSGRQFGVIGNIGGFDVDCSVIPEPGGDLTVRLELHDVPRGSFTVTRETFMAGGVGMIQRIENRMAEIPKLIEKTRTELQQAQQTVADAESRIGQPFKHTLALSAAEANFERVSKELLAMQRKNDAPNMPATPADARPELTVEAVRAYQPRGGVRSDPDQQRPHSPAAAPSAFDPVPLRPSGLQIGR
ncbi:helicase-related protein [Leucobacter sp. NPDC077196]|uniref:helicase-related protein n=1 Tax=Leucobacter sp. NPDC077196 TaxID=3154959 RepID=UPI003422B85F